MNDGFMATPPADVEAEQALLGCLITSQAARDLVGPMLGAAAFYRVGHGVLFDVIMGMHSRGAAVDAVTVRARVEAEGKSREAFLGEGPVYLHTLLSSFASAAAAESYGRTVIDRATARRAIEVGTRVVQMAARAVDSDETLAVLAEGQRELAAAADLALGPQDMDLGALIDDALDRIDSGEPWSPTGIPGMDECTGGLRQGQLVVIGARPSVGKSAVAMQMAVSLATTGLGCLIESLEMTSREWLYRAFSHMSGVDFGRIIDPKVPLSEPEWRAVSRVSGTLTSSAFFVCDTGAIGVAEVRRDLETYRRKFGAYPAAVVIDHLQIMRQPRAAREDQALAMITGELKALAKRLNITVVLLCQLNRGPASEQRRPRMSDLRGAGSIEEDADVVVLLDRDAPPDPDNPATVDNDPGVMRFNVAKSRNTRTGAWCLLWDGSHQTVSDKPWSASLAAQDVHARRVSQQS
jgi:replicative DNA helicase